jgi:pyridoxal/pyridoxine/pyridoxamine kinase
VKSEEEIRKMLNWLIGEKAPEPDTMVESGYVENTRQAIEILEWVLSY